MRVEGFHLFGGRHCETSALWKVLKFRGAPWSEEMLLGIGGGIGFIYWFSKGMAAPFIGTRYGGRESFPGTVCRRLSIPFQVVETGSGAKAHRALQETLAAGQPALVYGDIAYLPHFHASNGAHFGGHSFVVYGLDEEKAEVLISDRGRHPVRVTVADLRQARGSAHRPFPPRHRLFRVGPVKEGAPLANAIRGGLRDCLKQLLHPPMQNIGLPGIRKWAGVVASEWLEGFEPGAFYNRLCGAFVGIETGGTGGGAFRDMFARFLCEAARDLHIPDLEATAGLYRKAAEAWSRVAEAALPDTLPVLAKTRAALWDKSECFEDQGAGAQAKAARVSARLDGLRDEAHSINMDQARQVARGLQASIQECLKTETAAAADLAAKLP